MKILNLTLQNFRGIKELSFDFGGNDARIYGANGTGKTTIANAVCWLIADQAATGEKDFDPKTTGSHNLHHQAQITLEIAGGERITFGKDFHEIWRRKKGSDTQEFSGHTIDYSINKVPAKKKEYDMAMENACGCKTEKIKMLMLLGYFAEEMSVDDRRKILFDVCGNVSDQDVISSNGLDDLTKYLQIPGSLGKQFYSTDEYLKIAKVRKTELNHSLDVLPERIDELQRSIPETIEDGDIIRSEVQRMETEKESIKNEAAALQTDDGHTEAIRAAIAGMNTEMEKKRAAYIKQGNDANKEIYDAINVLNNEKNAAASKATMAKMKAQRLDQEHKRLNQMREKLLAEYAAAQAEQWDDGNEICPTCGQPLPAERVQELRDAFNQKKSETKERINRDGQSCSQAILQKISADTQDAETEKSEAETTMADIDIRIQNLQQSITTIAEFETTAEYKDIRSKIDALRSKQDSGPREAANEVQIQAAEKIASIDEKIQSANMRIAQIQLVKSYQARIDDLESEKKNSAAELEKVERGIHLCDEFTRAKVRMVNDRINSHFKTIHFQLFKDQINGGLKETCDPTVQNAAGEWVEYKSANTAAQVNAGLEIIDTLNKHYGTSLPVIMDRAESVCQVTPIDEQLIQLIVSAPDDTLRLKIIERENEK